MRVVIVILVRAKPRSVTREPSWRRVSEDKDRLSYAEFLRRVRDLECKDGVVRASLGLATTFKDVYQFVEFLREFVDRHARTDERAARTELQTLLAPSGARA